MTSDYAEQIQIHKAWRHANRAVWDVRTPENRWAASVASEAYHRMQTQEGKKFAQSRGWSVAGRPFTLVELRERRVLQRAYRLRHALDHDSFPVIDHAEHFKVGRCPVGILSHTYAPWENCVAFAQKCGLAVEQLEFSWYYPNRTLAVLFTARQAVAAQ